MLLLAIDTAGPDCAVALARAGERRPEILARIEERIGRGHAERLMPMIEAALGEAQRRLRRPRPDRGDDRARLVHRRPRRRRRRARAGARARHSGGRRRQPRGARASGRARARASGTVVAALDAKRGEVYALAQDLASGDVADRSDSAFASSDSPRGSPAQRGRSSSSARARRSSPPLLGATVRDRRQPTNRPTSPTSPRSASRADAGCSAGAALCPRRRRQAAGRQGRGAPMRPLGPPGDLDPPRGSGRLRRAVRNPCERFQARLERRGVRGAACCSPACTRCIAHYRNALRPARRRPASSSTGSPPTRRRSSPSPSRRACRRRGIGKALLEDALRHLYREGAQQHPPRGGGFQRRRDRPLSRRRNFAKAAAGQAIMRRAGRRRAARLSCFGSSARPDRGRAS